MEDKKKLTFEFTKPNTNENFTQNVKNTKTIYTPKKSNQRKRKYDEMMQV